MSDPLIGKRLEKCRILGKLGKGGMGAVYLAEHETLNKKVAVKILPDQLAANPEGVARFRREAKTASSLNHPNLIQVYDIGYADKMYFLVMQYIEGESLQTAVDAFGSLKPLDACRVAIEILKGLHHAHKANIVHRDVKPDNILMGPNDRPIILDFGLAMETKDSLQLTNEGTLIGTPYFISPEQARGQKATAQSDIYSVGVTLYYMLTGKHPFTAETTLAILNKHIMDTPLSPDKLNPKVAPALNEIVLRLMAKRPDDRYKTAIDAAHDLEKFLEGNWEKKRDTRRVEKKPSVKKQVLIAAGAVVFVILLSLGLIISGNGNGPKPPPDPDNGGSKPPPPDVYAKAREELQGILDFQREVIRDYALIPQVFMKYEDLVSKYPEFDAASDAEMKFRDELETLAGRLKDTVTASVDELERNGKLADALMTLRGFSPPLREHTPSGMEVEERIGSLTAKIDKKFAADKAEFDLLLSKGEIGKAKKLVDGMPEYLIAAEQSKIRPLREKIAAREKQLLDKAIPRIRKGLRVVEDRVADHLKRGDADGAIRILDELVKQYQKREIEGAVCLYSDYNYAKVPNRIGAWLDDAKDEPRALILLWYRDAYTLRETPRRDPWKLAEDVALSPRQIGLAFLYSDSPDRYVSAYRWLSETEEPAFRMAMLKRESLRQKTEILQKYLARPAAQLKAGDIKGARASFNSASEIMSEKHLVAPLREEVRTLQAGLLLAESEEQTTVNALKTLDRLRTEFKDVVDQDKLNQLETGILFKAGSWGRSTTTISARHPYWGWNGKGGGAPAPATEEKKTIRLQAGRIMVNPSSLKSYTGMQAQIRVNQASPGFYVGLMFDTTSNDRTYKLLVIRTASVELWSVKAGAPVVVLEVKAVPKIKVGEWLDLGFVIKKNEIVCRYNGRFIFRSDMILSSKNAVGLWASSSANFRQIRIRK